MWYDISKLIKCRLMMTFHLQLFRGHKLNYRKISNISWTKCQNLNFPHPVLQLSLLNPLKSGVMSRMKMQLEQLRQAMLQLHLRDQQFYNPFRCTLY